MDSISSRGRWWISGVDIVVRGSRWIVGRLFEVVEQEREFWVGMKGKYYLARN
jgi:hypothetical protein